MPRGSYATEGLATLAQQLVRGTGGSLTNSGWYHLEEEWDFQDAPLQRALRAESEKNPEPDRWGP